MTDDEPSDGGAPPDGAPPRDGAAAPDGALAEIPVIVEGPGDGVSADPIAAKLAELETMLAVSEKEKKDNWDKYVRAVADLENGRKRSRREVEEAKIDAKIKVLKEMLPVVDNLERAIEHAQAPSPDPPPTAADAAVGIIEGVRLVLRQFHTAFERLEVAPVEAEGQPFDPNFHEAISQVESEDKPPGTVISVLQKGYRVGDRLLRPAMVVVAKAKAGE